MLSARILVCCRHADIRAIPWNGEYLHDWDRASVKCTPDSVNCAYELLCAARTTGNGEWQVSSDAGEQDPWTPIEASRAQLHCRDRHDVELHWAQFDLDEILAQAHRCLSCNGLFSGAGPGLCFDCWKEERLS